MRVELRDTLELFVLPGLAAVLPWGLCFKLFRRMAHWQWLYREPCESALAQARSMDRAGPDEAHWIWTRRLITLVDHADHYLGLWRSDAWMRRHLQVTGAWPADPRGLVLLTFHWGAGYWGLRHAAAHGIHPHALMASLHTEAYRGRRVQLRYARARNAHVERTLGAQPIDVALQLKRLVQALRAGDALLGVVDVPADDHRNALGVTLLNQSATLAGGLLRRAVESRLPVVVYITGLNTQTGARTLAIHPLGVVTDLSDLAQQVYTKLDAVLAQDTAAWHFWAIAERVFGSGPRP